MRVAFDVQGTLLGSDQETVLKLFKYFESRGCHMIVWSWGGASMASSCIQRLKINAEPMSKVEMPGYWDDDKDYREVDICVDDESLAKEALSSRHVILVHEIPDDESLFDDTYGHLLRSEQ